MLANFRPTVCIGEVRGIHCLSAGCWWQIKTWSWNYKLSLNENGPAPNQTCNIADVEVPTSSPNFANALLYFQLCWNSNTSWYKNYFRIESENARKQTAIKLIKILVREPANKTRSWLCPSQSHSFLKAGRKNWRYIYLESQTPIHKFYLIWKVLPFF